MDDVVNGIIEQLACPTCRSELEPGDDALVCSGCRSRYPIIDGIARLVPSDLPFELRKTADAFGWQWRHFTEMYDAYEGQFLDWIEPIAPADFRDKDVLDAGCGIGRHAFFAARYGAKSVIALDLSAAVETALKTLSAAHTARVVQGDILRPPFKRVGEGGGFDLIYSIGVLHHLPDPRAGFLALADLVRPGGRIAVWVYGYEHNGLVRNVIEPLRRATSHVSPPLLQMIAWPIAVAFHSAVKSVYRLARGTALGRRLPLADYVSSLSDFSFRQNYNIVFDQLVAPSAAYIRGEELREWLEAAGLEDISVTSRHGNSWRGHGRAPAEPRPGSNAL